MKKLLIILILICICSCKAQKEIQVERVEVPVVVTQEHTVESVKIDHVRDTVIQRDSIYHYIKGDTTIIERWHHIQGTTNIYKVDTLHVYDSVPYPVEVKTKVTETVEVPRKKHWWEKVLEIVGTLSLVICGIGIAYKIGKNKFI